MNKKKIMLFAVCVVLIIVSVISFWDYRNKISLEDEGDLMEMGETSLYFIRPDGSQVYFCKVEKNWIPEELINYLTEALREERLIERIEQIQADYRIVSNEEKEKFDVSEEERDRDVGLRLHYPVFKDDVWYCVSLTDEKDDIVVEHVGEDGCIVNYFFWNIMQWHKYTDVPMRSGGQKNSKPYFVAWEDTNYMTIPYWDEHGNEIIGVTVYKIYNNYGGDVTAIGRNSDGTIVVTPQEYDIVNRLNNLTEGATVWPIVVYY